MICDEGTELPELCGAGDYVMIMGDGDMNYCEFCPQGTFSTIQDQ